MDFNQKDTFLVLSKNQTSVQNAFTPKPKTKTKKSSQGTTPHL